MTTTAAIRSVIPAAATSLFAFSISHSIAKGYFVWWVITGTGTILASVAVFLREPKKKDT
jgi:hypothetical protein